MKKTIYLLACISFISGTINAQSLVGKKVSDVKNNYTASHVFKIPNSTLYRTIFYLQNENEQPSVYEYVYSDQNGNIKIQLPDKYSFVDKMYYDIDTSFGHSYSDFSEGYAVIMNIESEKMGLINTEGKIIIEPQYTILGNFSEGLAYFANLERCDGGTTLPNKMGYIDIANKHIIELPSKLAELYGCCYFSGNSFKNGIAIMSTREFGYDCNSWAEIIIDKNGKVLNYQGELLDVNYKPVKLD